MSKHKENVGWNFPSNNYGPITGISDGNIEFFSGSQIASLAKECCQNSLDARGSNNKPAIIEFKTFSISPENIPGIDILKEKLKLGLQYCKDRQKHNLKAVEFYENALKVCNGKTISCLRISDFNTTGVECAAGHSSHWENLIKASGVSDKSDSCGGSKGVGKFSSFTSSNLRTVFYHTVDSHKQSAYQGVARLTTYKELNGDMSMGIGFFGLTAKNTPVTDQTLDLDKSFKRNNQTGTDIYILGVKNDKNWVKKAVKAVLDNFLFTIFESKLEVNIDKFCINKRTLPEIFTTFDDSVEITTKDYYDLLQEDVNPLSKNIRNMGEIELRLAIDDKYKSRRVAMVRSNGMKIYDRKRFKSGVYFCGILRVKGQNLNAYLRSLEDPTHSQWEEGRADNPAEAEKILKEMNEFINSSFSEAYDTLNVSEEFATNFLQNFSFAKIEEKKVSIPAKAPSTAPSQEPEKKSETVRTTITELKPRAPRSHTYNPNAGNYSNKTAKQRTTSQPKEKATNNENTRVVLDFINKYRYISTDPKNGKYLISVEFNETIDTIYVDLRVATENEPKEVTIKSARLDNASGHNVLYNNRIRLINTKKDTQYIIFVELDRVKDYCCLEVSANAS